MVSRGVFPVEESTMNTAASPREDLGIAGFFSDTIDTKDYRDNTTKNNGLPEI